MTSKESATEALHTSGYRLTMQRQLVWDTLRHSKKHISADDILGSVRRQYPRFNLATIYRSLEVLEELGLVKETRIRDRAYYELADRCVTSFLVARMVWSTSSAWCWAWPRPPRSSASSWPPAWRRRSRNRLPWAV